MDEWVNGFRIVTKKDGLEPNPQKVRKFISEWTYWEYCFGEAWRYDVWCVINGTHWSNSKVFQDWLKFLKKGLRDVQRAMEVRKTSTFTSSEILIYILASRRRNEEIKIRGIGIRNHSGIHPLSSFKISYARLSTKISARGRLRMRCRFVSLWTVHVNLMTWLWVSVKHIWTKKQVHVQREREREREYRCVGVDAELCSIYLYTYYTVIYTYTVLYLLPQ